MTKKTIQFNPNYFTLSGKKTISKKEKKRNASLANPNKIKKQLIMKIKEYQKRENKKGGNTEGGNTKGGNTEGGNTEGGKQTNDDIKNFEDEFNKSLNFLQELSNKHSKHENQQNHPYKHQTKNTSLKPNKFLSSVQDNINIDYPSDDILRGTPFHGNPVYPDFIEDEASYSGERTDADRIPRDTRPNILNPLSHGTMDFTKSSPSVEYNSTKPESLSININSSKIKTEPPYSILKNGSKPTYRQWLRETQKVYSHGGSQKHQPIIIENKPINNNIPERKKELSRIKEQLHNTIHKSSHNTSKQTNTIKTKKITKTIKRKLGKSGRKISILIKNRETRKKIQTEKALLNRKNIAEVKQYLREHNLIKTGTTAPNYILRNLYENSILSGEINNKSSNVLLHNFINNQKSV